MTTDRPFPPRAAVHPSVVLAGAVAAVAVPLELVAGAAARPTSWFEPLSRSSIAVLVLIGAAVAVVVRAWRVRPDLRLALVGAGLAALGLRLLAAALTDTAVVDPVGRGGPLAPGTAAVVQILMVVLVVLAGGAFAVRPLPALDGRVAVASVFAAGALLWLVESSIVAAVVSTIAAVVIIGAAAGSVERPLRPAVDLVALGIVITAPAITAPATRFVLDRYVERVVDRQGAAVVVGPLFPPALWAATVTLAVGALVAPLLAVVASPGSRRSRLDQALAGPARFVPPIVAAAYLFRLWALYAVSTARRDSGDPFFYHVTANILAHGRGFEEPLTWISTGTELPSALHGPGFPAALFVISRLGGVSYVDHQWASIVFGLPQVAFAVLLAHLLAGRRAALLTGAVCVIYPNLWLTDGSLFVEGLMAGFTTAATYAMYRWVDRPRRLTVVVIGVLIGLAALTRGEALLLIPLFFGGVVLLRRCVDWRTRLAHAAIGSVAAVATLAPWMIYNAPRFNVFVPLSTNSNEVLFYANCDDVYFGPLLGFWSFDCQTRHRAEFGEAPGDQAEQAVYWRKLAIEYIREHIDRVPVVLYARVGRQWEFFRPEQTVNLSFVEGRDKTATQWGQWMFYAMMPLAVVGSVAIHRRRRHPLLPMWSHAIAVTATALYAYGTLRFRAPWEPILCVLASIGGVALWDWWRRRRAPEPPADSPAPELDLEEVR